MKRRSFLQTIIGAIAGLFCSSSVKGNTKYSRAIHDKLIHDFLEPDEHFPYNGTVWTSPNHLTVIVLYGAIKEGDEWGYYLISPPYSRYIGLRAEDGRIEGTASMVCHLNKPFHGFYNETQLRKKLAKWKRRPELELRMFNNQTEQVVYYDG